MALRDHFHAPLDKRRSWEGLHGQWPAMLVLDLTAKLPPRYIVEPRVHLGASFEIDVATYEGDESTPPVAGESSNGGVATALWAPAQPTLHLETEVPDDDEYAALVFDLEYNQRLVAAVEIISPSNKDRPEKRRAFATKCAALVRQGICVAIVDVVTKHHFNLYSDMLNLLGHTDASLTPRAPSIYAAACRWTAEENTGHFCVWNYPLAIRQPLPTLPLWLSDNLAVALELEATYEATCSALRIA